MGVVPCRSVHMESTGASLSDAIFIFVSPNKNIRIFYPCHLRPRILLGHTSLLHPFLQTTVTEFDSLKARK